MEFSHKSVLLNETIDALQIKPDGIYVDGTLGGGGHSYEICKRLGEHGRLIGIDQDSAAIEAGTQRLEPFKDKVTIVRSNYCQIRQIMKDLNIEKVDGILLDLGVSSYQLDTVERGFTYREDITEELGIDMSQVTKPEDLTAVFAKVKEAYPDMTIIDPNRANALFESYLGKIAKIDPLGDNIASSVSGVAYQDNATVVDMYETTDFKELCELTRSWFEAGYYASDAATTTATTAELLMSGNCFGTFCGLGNPKIAQQYTNNYGHPFENVQISDSMIWSGNGGAWMVNSGCKDPSAACKFMNLLYTDAYIDNLLVYGEEGVDYKLDENGCAVAPDGYTDLNSVAYTDNMNYYFWGNKWLTYPVVGGLYGEEKETNKQQNYDGDHSNYYGFLYDYSDKEAEYTACLNIVEEYKKSLWVGAADVDTTLAEMTKRLKAAGMDDLIQAKQEQLDAWMSSK